MNVVLYTLHCPACKIIQKTMDQKRISYQIIDNRNLVLEQADRFKTNDIPFATIDGQFFDTSALKKFVEGYNI